MKITKRQLKRIIAEESRRLRRLREDAIDTELDHLKKNIEDDIEHIRDLKDDVKDDHEEELRAEKAKREERTDESVARRKLRRQIRRMLREEQGYDDREDERLGAEHGGISDHDFDGDHEEEEHSRRDDAHFEDRVHVPDIHVHIHDSRRRSGKKLNETVGDLAVYQDMITNRAQEFAYDIAEQFARQFAEDMEGMFIEEPEIFNQSQEEWNGEVDYAAEIIVDEISSLAAEPIKAAIKPIIERVIEKIETDLHNGDFARY